jgi:HAD superfamily hydrolase (TIGR01484 family)
MITYNGALLWDPRHQAPIAHHPLERETALRVLAEARTLDPSINVGVELEDEWHLDRVDERLRHLHATGRIPDFPIEGDVDHAVATTARGVSKLYFVVPAEVRTALEQRFAAARLAISVTSSGSEGEGRTFVEVQAPGVSKGAALRTLAALLGIPRHETIALGDEENDMPALGAAGLGIAMGNATERVKAAAGAVTGPNTADGWAEAVERHALGGGLATVQKRQGG